MQKMHIASADKPTTLYSLDVTRAGVTTVTSGRSRATIGAGMI